MKIISGYMDCKMRNEMDKSIGHNNAFPIHSPRFKPWARFKSWLSRMYYAQ
jgi:hypothetical protein